MEQAQATRSSSRVADFVLLVHGVGFSTPGAILHAVQTLTRGSGPGENSIREYEWNDHVDQPFEEDHVSASYVSNVIRGLLGCAGFVSTSSRHHRIGYMCLVAATSLSPYAAALGIFGAFHGFGGSFSRFISITWPWIVGTWAAVLLTLSASFVLFGDSDHAGSHRERLRSVLLVFAWPFIAIWGICSTLPWKTAFFLLSCLTILAGGVAVHVWNKDAHFEEVTTYWSPTQCLHNLRFVLPTLAVLYGAALLGSRVVRRYLAPLVKVSADVVRYIGDAEYHSSLQHYFVQCFERADELSGQNVVVCGHSLGSVIAVEGLLTLVPTLSKAKSVALVTGGSPLLRYFHGFFPRQFMAPDEYAERLEKLPNFRWVNIYRPRDPIGGAIFTRSRPNTIDVSTLQRSGFLRAHIGYFADQKVFECVQQALEALSCHQPLPSTGATELRSVQRSIQATASFQKLMSCVLATCLTLPLILLWTSIPFESKDKINDHLARKQIVQKHPICTNASVDDDVSIEEGPRGDHFHTHPFLAYTSVDSAHSYRVPVDAEVTKDRVNGTTLPICYSATDPTIFYVTTYEPRLHVDWDAVLAYAGLWAMCCWFGLWNLIRVYLGKYGGSGASKAVSTNA